MLRRERKTAIIIALLLLAIAVLLGLYFIQDADIPGVTLADQMSAGDTTGQNPPQNPMAHVEITGENVQSVIATLARPEHYSRQIRKIRYWSQGERSATQRTEIWSTPEAVRIRRDDGENMIFKTDHYYIWFEGGGYIFRSVIPVMGRGLQQILDEFQGTPSYETVLEVERSQIREAGYTLLTVDGEEQYVIYVEVRNDILDHVDRYYISLLSGLLLGVETWEAGILIYRMETLSLSLEMPEEEMFTLPEGRILGILPDGRLAPTAAIDD